MPYLLLASAGFIPFLALIRRRRDPALLATFFVASGLINLADWVVYGWFELYNYRTGLLADPVADSTLGLLLGEFIFVPSLCVLCAAWLQGWKGTLAATTLLVALEWLFLRIDVYDHRGWTLAWTVATFPVYFQAVEAFRRGSVRHGLAEGLYREWFRASVAFWEAAVVTAFLRATKLVKFNVPILASYFGNQSLGRFLTYALFFAPLGYWVMAGKNEARSRRLAAAAVATIGWLITLEVSRVQTHRLPWHFALDTLAVLSILWIGCQISDLVDAYRIEGCTRSFPTNRS